MKENITIEQARELIENKILKDQRMPVYDEIVYKIVNNNEIEEYSFRGLLKYVYELK